MKERLKIILLGGGGHAKVLLEYIISSGQYDVVGILDPKEKEIMNDFGVSVLGGDELLADLYIRGIRKICIAVGSVKDNNARRISFEKAKKIGFYAPPLIHPTSIVSATARISEGAQVLAGAIIQSGSAIGENTIINTGAIVEHDCVIGKHVHICPGAVVCGGSMIGDNTFVGAGATIIQGITIGKSVIMGAGAVVLKNIADSTTVVGVPAKEIL